MEDRKYLVLVISLEETNLSLISIRSETCFRDRIKMTLIYLNISAYRGANCSILGGDGK